MPNKAIRTLSAACLLKFAAQRKPPLHLPVGADAVQLVEQRHNSVLNDIKAWRAKSSNTAFNAG